MWKCILVQSVPLMIAQLVQLLYNVVDRIYIGHMSSGDSLALTGIGLTFPVVTLIVAFSALFGVGGVPLFSIKRGGEDDAGAAKVIGCSLFMLIISSVVITILGYIFMEPILFAFGAGEESYLFASDYLKVYLIGTAFSMIASGMNGYISAQGFPGVGMISVIIGAVVNIILDPIFIFVFGLGVKGAALASVISQLLSALWVFLFLASKKALIPLKKKNIGFDLKTASDIIKLGLSSFIMQGTACAVQIVCNSTLQRYGGDIYVGVMTVANSIREIFMLPINGIINGAMPVIGFHYGARSYSKARSGIRFNALFGAVYTLFAWLAVIIFPRLWLNIFTDDAALVELGIGVLRIYFFGFVFMAFQFAGQSAFQALNDSKHAIFFSLLRKAFIVIPLTMILPAVGFGVNGVFLAEPVSNVIGGTACFTTMYFTVYKRLHAMEKSS